MKFADIVGQNELKQHMQNAILLGKVSHAYIISGEEGSGKMMLAEAFAQTLECERHEADACGECHSCKQAQSHNQPDIVYVTHEKPNTISVDDIRMQINNDIVTKPYASPYKVYIVDEAEKMNEQAQNALLKTLEEPPAYAVILLLTTNASSFLPTIRSRCIQLEMKPIADSQIRKYLMATYEIPDYEADAATAFAQGNMGRAISLAGSEDFRQLRGFCLNLVQKAGNMSAQEHQTIVNEWKNDPANNQERLELLMVWFRDVVLYKATGQGSLLINSDQEIAIRRQAQTVSWRHLKQITDALQRAEERLRANVSVDLTVEILLEALQRGME